MWNWHWQSAPDYGTKYDYGVLEATPHIMSDFWNNNKHKPAKGWVASALRGAGQCRLPRNCELIHQQPWTEIGRAMGGLGATGDLQFTRGTIIACWAIENADPGDKVILVGFDNIYARTALSIEAGFPAVYIKEETGVSFRGYKEGRKYGNHDFWCERPVMERLAGERGVQLLFSQDIW